ILCQAKICRFSYRLKRCNIQENKVCKTSCVSKNGGFFYCPDEAMYHRDRGHKIQEYGQVILKVTDQRRSAVRTGPSGSDNAVYVTDGPAQSDGTSLLMLGRSVQRYVKFHGDC